MPLLECENIFSALNSGSTHPILEIAIMSFERVIVSETLYVATSVSEICLQDEQLESEVLCRGKILEIKK